MAERIDHAAAAKRYLPEHGDGIIPGRLSVAQVHATLALAEQQRTANLIAYVHLLETQYARADKQPGMFDETSRADSVRRHGIVQAQIREALGLS